MEQHRREAQGLDQWLSEGFRASVASPQALPICWAQDEVQAPLHLFLMCRKEHRSWRQRRACKTHGSLSLFTLGHLQAVCEGIHLIICFTFLYLYG